MKFRGLIVAVALLAALTGTLYWSDHYQSTETAKSPADVPPKILSLNQGDIVGIAIKKKDGDEIILKRGANDWQITAPQTLPADQSAVTGMLSTLSNFDSQRLVEDKAGDLNPYGLVQPALLATITQKDQKNEQLLIGDDTPTGGGVYAKLGGDPRVFTIASFNKSSLDKSLNDLRDKRLITAEPDKITQLSLVTAKQDIEFGRDKDQWQILKPKPMRAEGSKVDDLVRAVTDAKMDLSSSSDPKKSGAAFASGSPVASVKLATGSGSQALQVRKAKDDYYAKSTIVDGVYKISSSLGTQLDKKLEDFRNQKIFDFGFGDPDKIELHDGDKAYFFTRGGDDWWSADGKKLDVDGVQQLVSKLRDLQASKFVDSGFTTPVMRITVLSNGGKRLESVLIAKAASGSNYLAQRQNEPTLYLLDEGAVSDLRKLAGDVKPANAPKK